MLVSGSFHIIFSQTLRTYNSLMVGSLVRNIWNTGGGRLLEHLQQLLRMSTQSYCISWVIHTLLIVTLANNSSPSCISSKKNFWTASESFKSGNLESLALSLASFCSFVLKAGSWSWGHSAFCGQSRCSTLWRGHCTCLQEGICSGPPSSLNWGMCPARQTAWQWLAQTNNNTLAISSCLSPGQTEKPQSHFYLHFPDD